MGALIFFVSKMGWGVIQINLVTFDIDYNSSSLSPSSSDPTSTVCLVSYLSHTDTSIHLRLHKDLLLTSESDSTHY